VTVVSVAFDVVNGKKKKKRRSRALNETAS